MHPPVPFWLRVSAWFSFAGWAAAVTILSSLTPRELEDFAPFELWDKAVHFLAFAAGAVTLTLALHWNMTWSWPRLVVVASAAIALFGVLDEYHQTFTPGRFGDVSDWIADTLGAFAGALGTARFHARTPRTPRLASVRD